jgi:hypothetical protein
MLFARCKCVDVVKYNVCKEPPLEAKKSVRDPNLGFHHSNLLNPGLESDRRFVKISKVLSNRVCPLLPTPFGTYAELLDP